MQPLTLKKDHKTHPREKINFFPKKGLLAALDIYSRLGFHEKLVGGLKQFFDKRLNVSDLDELIIVDD